MFSHIPVAPSNSGKRLVCFIAVYYLYLSIYMYLSLSLLSVVVVVVVVEILFCIADKTGNGAQYYGGDKVMAKSQGYNKQASTKERKTQKTQIVNTQKEKRKGKKEKRRRRRRKGQGKKEKKNKRQTKRKQKSTVESQLGHDSKSKPRCWLAIKRNL